LTWQDILVLTYRGERNETQDGLAVHADLGVHRRWWHYHGQAQHGAKDRVQHVQTGRGEAEQDRIHGGNGRFKANDSTLCLVMLRKVYHCIYDKAFRMNTSGAGKLFLDC